MEVCWSEERIKRREKVFCNDFVCNSWDLSGREMEAVYIWRPCNAAALERDPGTRQRHLAARCFKLRSQNLFQAGRSTLKITRVPDFSLKDGLLSNHDITWPSSNSISVAINFSIPSSFAS